MNADVFLDARRASWNPASGTGIYARQLVDALRASRRGISIEVLERSRFAPMLDASSRRVARWPRKLLSDLIEIPLAGRGARVVHLLYPEAASTRTTVLTIQDVDVVQRGPGYPSSAHYYGWRTSALARRSVRVVCPSEQTRADIAHLLGRSQGVDVVHHGVDLPEKPPRPWAANHPYFLYPGGASLRKNVHRLLAVWSMFAAHVPGELVITGPRRDWPATVPERVRFVGTLSREEYWSACASALGILYLSPREGFGMPILEGALLGRPVVCGSVGVVPELPPDLVRIVDVANEDSVHEAMQDVANGWLPAENAIKAARTHFTWPRSATEMVAIYEACL